MLIVMRAVEGDVSLDSAVFDVRRVWEGRLGVGWWKEGEKRDEKGGGECKGRG